MKIKSIQKTSPKVYCYIPEAAIDMMTSFTLELLTLSSTHTDNKLGSDHTNKHWIYYYTISKMHVSS